MERISKYLTNYVIYKGVINEEDRDIYEYGFEITLEVGLYAIFCFIITLYLHMFFEGVLFFVIFVPLRSYAGGLHLKKYYSCFVLSSLTFVIILILVKHIRIPIYISFIMLLFLIISVYILYPVENVNRKVDAEENQYFKSKLRQFLFIDLIIAIGCIVLNGSSELFLITTTFSVVVITMLIAKIEICILQINDI